MAEQQLFKASELAEILGFDVQTIYRMGKRGELETYKIGRSVRFVMPEKERQNNDAKGKSS